MTVKVVQGLGIRALTTYKELLEDHGPLPFLPDILPIECFFSFFLPSLALGVLFFLVGGFLEC